MAQIIKHRRGSIAALKDVTANVGELVMATGSIGDLNAPVLFIGSDALAGGYKPVSKIYQGSNAPVLGAAYGSTMDGTPFYSSNDKTLYILDRNGNIAMDFTGNIEGNTITGTTILNLTSSFVSASNTVSAPTGSFGQIQVSNIAFSGLTEGRLALVGPTGSIVDSGSLTFNNNQLGITGSIKLNDSAYIYNDGQLYIEDNVNGIYLNAGNSYFNFANNGYTNLRSYQNGIDIEASAGGQLWLWADSNDVWIGSYDNSTLHLNADGGEGNVNVLNGGGNQLNVYGNMVQTGSIYTTKILGTGSLYLQPDQNDGRYFEIYNTAPSDTHIKASGGISYFGDDTNYLRIEDGSGTVTVNAINVEISGSIYAELHSGNEYIWTEAGNGAFMESDSNGLSGFSARENGIAEITGSLGIYGDTQIDGNTSVTGSLVVTAGAAFIDQGVVSQNSNVLLTSGSSLIIQDGGNANIAGNVYITGSEAVDYIYGYTSGSSYLAFNNGPVGAPGVELGSGGNISLWAEGGYVNVTGSLNVTGDIVFSGSINIGDNLGQDTINFQGEVSSSILPKVNDAFNLGGPDNYWHDLYVSGTAHVGVLEAGSITLSGITVFNDLQVSGSIFNFTLSPTDVVFVDADQRLTGSAAFTYAYDGDYGDNVLTAPIIRASNDGNGTNFLIGNDMWLGDINEGNATRFMGNEDNNIAKIYLGSNSGNDYLESNYSNVTLRSNNNLNLQSQNSSVYLESYDGRIYLNNDSGNRIQADGEMYFNRDTYFNPNTTMYVTKMVDNNDGVNYLQLYGYGTDNSSWWESGTGRDATLYANETANINIINQSGKVNIDVTDSVNLHTNNGFNVTGSMIVSDGSGVFNSSLIVNNSDLTLDGGSNVHMNDGAHLYFDNCVDMYYDSGDGNFIFYNDCNNFQFRNNVSITGSINISNGIYTDNIYGASNSSNVLRLYGGAYNAPNVELASSGQISLFSEGGSGVNYAINMTGSVHMMNDLDVSGSLYAGGINNYNSNINGGGIYIDSGNYSEISYNDEEVYLYVSSDGIQGTSYSGTNTLTSNAGDTTINANNGYNVNINANNILLNGPTAVTGAFTVSSGSMTSLGGDLYVSGNLQVLGSSTNVNLQSHTVDIGDNIILVNAYSPFQRYAGIAGFDSGSSGASGSLLWDSLNNYWNFVTNAGSSSKMIGTTATALGSEISLTSGTFPIASGDDTIEDSLLTYSGTTLAYNTNKFTIDSSSGDTYISGNVTIAGVGGTDNGEGSSYVVFRNSDNILGWVSPEDTTTETTQLMGYETATGNLVFSSLIDGGTY